MPDLDITPEQLASALAARLIHDIIGPASGVVSAFDLIADPKAAPMREEALALAEESARKLVDLLVMFRAIYAGGATMTAADLRGFAERMVAGTRATLDLTIDVDATSDAAVRLTLGLLQIAATSIPAGGAILARLVKQGDRLVIEGEATGPRSRVGQEVLDGLARRPSGEGSLHRWSAAYLLGAIAESAGGAIDASVGDGGLAFRADIRADTA